MERAFSVCGTIEYMAPEIVEGGESGHDKVICVFVCYAVICLISSSIVSDSVFLNVHALWDFSFSRE